MTVWMTTYERKRKTTGMPVAEKKLVYLPLHLLVGASEQLSLRDECGRLRIAAPRGLALSSAPLQSATMRDRFKWSPDERRG